MRHILYRLLTRFGWLHLAYAVRTECNFRLAVLQQPPAHELPSNLILSLTSYPDRFAKLHYSLKTLLAQDVRADRVILWVYKRDMDELPSRILRLQARGLEIRSTEQDLRSYKKLIPALQTFPTSFVVTADDDILYGRSWLRTLCSEYSPGVKEIVAHRAHRITLTREEVPSRYGTWEWNIGESEPSPLIFPTSGGGCLFPPGCFAPDILNTALMKRSAPTSDDLWFYFMFRLAGFQARKVGPPFSGFSMHADKGLSEHNVPVWNDIAMRDLNEIYHLFPEQYSSHERSEA